MLVKWAKLSRPPLPSLAGVATMGAAADSQSASADEELREMRAALAVAGWPASLADDLSKRPKVLPNAKALVDAVLFSSHVDEIFVLRNGVQLLGHDDALPATFTRALQGASSVRDFLAAIDEETLSSWRGRVYCYASGTLAGDERELKTHDGAPLDSLLDKWRALPLAHPEGNIYLGELRRREKYRHPLDHRWVKTLLARDVKDFVGRDRGNAMPYWDRYDEGVFVGARFGGSPLHVDQARAPCTPPAPLLHPSCTPPAPLLHPSCTPPAPLLHPCTPAPLHPCTPAPLHLRRCTCCTHPCGFPCICAYVYICTLEMVLRPRLLGQPPLPTSTTSHLPPTHLPPTHCPPTTTCPGELVQRGQELPRPQAPRRVAEW
jgi:hypothetical protein